MIVDTCTCGAEFHAGYSGLHAATDERFAHTEWLAAHAAKKHWRWRKWGKFGE